MKYEIPTRKLLENFLDVHLHRQLQYRWIVDSDGVVILQIGGVQANAYFHYGRDNSLYVDIKSSVGFPILVYRNDDWREITEEDVGKISFKIAQYILTSGPLLHE